MMFFEWKIEATYIILEHILYIKNSNLEIQGESRFMLYTFGYSREFHR